MYGPQTEWVKALVERARTLTADEVSALASAWDAEEDAPAAAWIAAGDAARDAAGAAAWSAAWTAAGDAIGVAGEAAREAAKVARVVEAAARGLAIRHLIGVGEYTRAHYDALVAPWRAAIGPAHPDDDD